MATIEQEMRASRQAAEDIASPKPPKQAPYTTRLSRPEEEHFQKWFQTYANRNGLHPNADETEHYYDYRGFWKENGPAATWNIRDGHFPDKWKKPGHPTFSVESVYAKDAPGLAGTWNEKGEWVAPPKTDQENVKMRQRYMESHFNDDIKDSPAGAVGRYQIMPIGLKQYTKDTGKTGDLRDTSFNETVRDHLMNRYYNLNFVKEGYPTDDVRTAKAVMSYNWGEGNAKAFLDQEKAKGVDIYGSLDWIEDIPSEETKNYLKFIIQGRDVSEYKNNEDYERLRKERLGR